VNLVLNLLADNKESNILDDFAEVSKIVEVWATKKPIDCIVSQMQKAENANEQLKAEQQLCWAQKMNSIRNRAEEIIRLV
jgi:hypothetical protein